MISTGREYDRFVIAMVIVSVIILGVYVVHCNRKQIKKIKNQETTLSDRLNYLTKQVNKTSENMKDYMEKPVVTPSAKDKEDTKEENIPNPVSSDFFK